MTLPYSALLVDLDGVLRIWPKDNAELESRHQLPVGAIAKIAFERELLAAVTTGAISDQMWRTEVGTRLSRSFPSSMAAAAIHEWSVPVGTLNAEVLRLVVQARDKYRVCLVTNATDRLPSDLEALCLSKHLDFIANSSEVGFSKPSFEFFVRALATAQVQPSEALFVDDTLENVTAANELGIRAHHFTSVERLATFLQSAGLPPNAA